MKLMVIVIVKVPSGYLAAMISTGGTVHSERRENVLSFIKEIFEKERQKKKDRV